MADEAKFAERADAVADTLRTFLIAIHTGGLGVVFAIASSLAEECVNPKWATIPALIFSSGLVLIGCSLLLAKHKALKRKDAAEKKHPVPEFKGLLVRNFTWEAITLALFAVGVFVGLWKLSCITVGCP